MSVEWDGHDRRADQGLDVIHEKLDGIKFSLKKISDCLEGPDGMIIRVDRLDVFKAAMEKQADRRWQIVLSIAASGIFSGSAVAAVIKIFGG